MNIFQIDQEFLRLQELLENSDGELTQEMEDILKNDEVNITSKYTNYVKMIKKFESDSDTVTKEIERLSKMKQSSNKAIDRLKSSLKDSMMLRKIEKYDDPLFKLSFLKSSSVEIIDEDLIPKKYITKKVVLSANKVEIKKVLLTGKKIEGVSLNEKQNLQIK